MLEYEVAITVELELVARRPSNDAGPGHIRQPAPGLAEQRPAAGGRRAAARRGGAGRVRPPGARSRPTTATLEAEGTPAAVEELREAIREADAVLIATPEYNHSIPGQLKNALDWVSRPAGKSALNGKPAAVIGASTGMFGAVWAQAELRKVLGAMGGRVVEAELPVGRAAEQLATASWSSRPSSPSSWRRSSPSWSPRPRSWPPQFRPRPDAAAQPLNTVVMRWALTSCARRFASRIASDFGAAEAADVEAAEFLPSCAQPLITKTATLQPSPRTSQTSIAWCWADLGGREVERLAEVPGVGLDRDRSPEAAGGGGNRGGEPRIALSARAASAIRTVTRISTWSNSGLSLGSGTAGHVGRAKKATAAKWAAAAAMTRGWKTSW